jgi:predicted MFS family arabinose efflux permease
VIETLRQRDFGLLWTAGLVSMTGTWMLVAVLPFLVYQETGSVLASAALFFAWQLPGLLFGSLAGVFVDRWNRRRTMIAVNLLQAASVLPLLVFDLGGWLPIVYVVVFVDSALAQFFAPAENALLPRLVAPERLLMANTLNALNNNLARVVGPLSGGALAAAGGLPLVALADAVSFAASALLILLVRPPASSALGSGRAPAAGDATVGRDAGLIGQWLEGLRRVRASPLLIGVFAASATAELADSIYSSLLAPFVEGVVAAGVEGFGLVLTVRGISGIVGGVVVARFAGALDPAAAIGWSLLAIGAGMFVSVNVATMPVLLAVLMAVGPFIVGWLGSQQTLLQSGTADAYRGRVFGAFGTTNAVALVVGTGLASLLGDIVGVVPLLNGSAALYVGAGLVATLALRRARRVAAPASPAPD